MRCLACTCGQSLFTVPPEAARPLLPPQSPADPDAPGPFAFANPDRTRGILANAGWSDATLTRHDVPMRIAAAGQLEQAVEFATRVGVLARMLAEEDPDTHARVQAGHRRGLQTV